MIGILLADHRHYHSDFQCDYAITVRAGGTLYGCYKQAVRELHKRWRGLRENYKLRSIAEIELRENRADNGTRGAIEAADLKLSLLESDGVIRDTEREFLRFYGQAVSLRRAIGLEDGETMPDELRERLDREMWVHHIKAMAAVDFMTNGRLGRGTVELLQSCPVEMRRQLGETILDQTRHGDLIEWYLTHDPGIPDPLTISQEEAKALLSGCVSSGGLLRLAG